MTDLVQPLTTFLREYLPRDCGTSPHTVASYALGFKLFIQYVCEQQHLRPCLLKLEDLNVDLILDFLGHLEKNGGNGVRTRNIRLAAIKSFFRYLEFHETSALEMAQQVHAIPMKRSSKCSIAKRSKPCWLRQMTTRFPASATGPCCISPTVPGCECLN